MATPEQTKWANDMSASYLSLKGNAGAADTQVKAATATRTARRQRLEELQLDVEQSAINTGVQDILAFSREQLHAERLPRLAAQSSVNAINRAMRKYLGMFSFPYPFRLNESLDFVVDLEHTKDVPAAVLSGGERVRAAIAMRFGLMEVFSAGAGMLIIDEPTTALDEDACTALIEVLTKAAAHFRKTNIKILCPTHATQLAGAADAVITIGG